VSRLSSAVFEPLVDDLAVRAYLAPHHPGVTQCPADVVDGLPRRDAGPVRQLIIIKRLGAGAYRRHDTVAKTAQLRERQYAPLEQLAPSHTPDRPVMTTLPRQRGHACPG
jgi:hypothetical protein